MMRGILAGWLLILMWVGGLQAQQTFVNPVCRGADPWVIRDKIQDRYLWCFSQGRQIVVYAGKSLTQLGSRHVVWTAPSSGPISREIWAPELHAWGNRWVICFAASDGQNVNHLSYVLCSRSPDPLGLYDLKGPMATGDGEDGLSPQVWSIDLTIMEHGGQRYALWSGWERPGVDHQYLYIRRMKSATELVGPRVKICDNDNYAWEKTEPSPRGRGLNEGPQVLMHHGRTFVFYSCGASWLPSYQLGMLELVGQDPMKPQSWKKFSKPAFASTAETYGVGHSCFVPSPDGQQWWHVFHAKQNREAGWARDVMMQPFTFDKTGLPELGKPIKRGVPQPVPSGQ